MAFDLESAKPVESGGFDLASAQPVDQPTGAAAIPDSKPMAPTPESTADVGGGVFSHLPGVLNPLARAATGAGETGLAAITSMAAPFVGIARGEKGAEGGTSGYQPKTKYGQQYTQGLGELLHEIAKKVDIPGLGQAIGGLGGELGALGHLAAPAAADTGAMGAKAAAAIKAAMPEKAIAAGNKAGQSMGAAKTAAELLRDERAQQVGVKLSKGAKSRDFGQIQFERETAKTDIGAPLRENTADNNEAILRQFDRFADETGATAPDLRTGGKIVDAALVTKVQQAKSKIRAAYKAADESGETAAPVSHGALTEYIGKQGPTVREKLAPILSAVEDQIKANDPKGTGQMTIKQAEEVRKLINKNAKEGTPDMVHGIEMKKIIDQMTDGAGGDLYKKARGLRSSYAREFEDKAAISKLLRQKPGTTDRAVALEDIHKHSILDGSTDDVREIKRTLQTGGEEGKQAWKELQGATINHFKEIATKSVQTDVRGNRVVSPAAFDKAIKSLDADGKLDVIFGKKGAGQLRDLNQTIMDAFTSPPGSVNSSNTSSAIMNILNKVETSGVVGGIDKALGMYTGIKPLKWGASKIKDARTARRVEDALK
jgi:hypothetical protein